MQGGRGYLFAGLLVVVLALAGSAGAGNGLELAEMGVFYVGGSRVSDVTVGTNGQSEWAGQAQVQYLEPSVKNHTVPVVMQAGLGLSSTIWLTTPDGREGWAQELARAGFDVYVYDWIDYDPSTLNTIPFRLVEEGGTNLPNVSKWGTNIWSRWGFGPSTGTPYPGVKFPVASIDQFYASFPMRVSGSGSSGGDDVDSLIALLEQIGPAVLMPHSAAGPDHFAVAQQREDLVAGMVVVEPTGCPGVDPSPVAGSIPFAALYADISNRSAQSGRKAACQATVDDVNANGGDGVMIDLTQSPYSLFDNTHLMMQDVDSATIAGHVIGFLNTHVPSGTPPPPPIQDLRLAQANRFFVGGALTGNEWEGQSLVHVLQPETQLYSSPIVLYPGAGLSSALWLSTPDGRDGWAQELARAGFAVYVFDPAHSNQSMHYTDPFDSVGTLPIVRKPNIPDIWPAYGFGAVEGAPNSGLRYPVADVDELYRSMTMQIAGGGGPDNEDNLAALLTSLGSAIVIAHGSAGATVFDVAASSPPLFKAIVGVEPDGCPDAGSIWADPGSIPVLALYGDYLTQKNQLAGLAACATTAGLIAGAGGVSEVRDLPTQGTPGNSHLMMQDDNSAQLAQDVAAWLAANLAAPVPPAPDGRQGTTPLRAERLDVSGGSIRFTWDAASCPADDYSLLAGPLGSVGAYVLTDAACGIGTTGTFDWNAVPGGDQYFLVVGTDGASTESGWGTSSVPEERNGTTPSFFCNVTTKDLAGSCP